MARELDAVHLRHVDVGEHEVGGHRVQQLERLAAVRRLADDRERQRAGAVVEELAQPPPRRRLVVDDQHAQRRVSHARLPRLPSASAGPSRVGARVRRGALAVSRRSPRVAASAPAPRRDFAVR